MCQTFRSTNELALRQAARSQGLQDVFRDGLGVRRQTPLSALAALLAAFNTNAAVDSPERLPPVIVATAQGRTLRIPMAGPAVRPQKAQLVLEEGESWPIRASNICVESRQMAIRLDHPLPVGLHRLQWWKGSTKRIVHVLAAPTTLATPANFPQLALFLPLHAVRSQRNFGVGDLTDLATLVDWSGKVAHAFVGTLPLFPTFLDDPFEPSPYRPVTRLFWNELFIDPRAAPEFAHPSVRAVAASTNWRRDLELARRGSHVDYRLAMSVKQRLLKAMAHVAFADPARRQQIESWVRTTPDADAYARFRAAVDFGGAVGNQPRGAISTRKLHANDFREADQEYYLYAQALLHEQMRALAGRAPGRSPLYLDLPVGVHPDGFDVWRHPHLFLAGASAGAPPDVLQEHGQVWALPPMHPTAGRADGYAHLRLVLRRMFAVSGVLRIDHVMGLHRIYCVPEGFDGRDGAYVRYPAEELYAIVMIEAHRAGAAVVGENLGTVPAAVNRAMKRRGLIGMQVQQFALTPRRRAIVPPGPGHLVSLNTHDTPTFAGFWNGDDIDLRRKLGIIDRRAAGQEQRHRHRIRVAVTRELERRKLPARSVRDVCRSLLSLHARGAARVELINLEDLWLEQRPQNVPGTDAEYPNWRRRAAWSLERIVSDPGLRRVLSQLAALRHGRRTRR